MKEHISKEQFDKIIAEDGMFKLIDKEGDEGMFWGTRLDFMNSFFSNVSYESVVYFANEYNQIVLEYPLDEHLLYLHTRRAQEAMERSK